MAIAMARPVEPFFSLFVSTDGLFPSVTNVDGLLLLVHDSTVYTRNEFEQEWLDCFKLDEPIVAIYPTSDSAS